MEGNPFQTPFWSKGFYDHKARWIHYWNQIKAVALEIRRRGGKMDDFSVLEIGPSHGLVTYYLKKFGVNIKTLDVKPQYQADFTGSVLQMPLPDNSFDLILICEVLEHLPFHDFPKALKELHRVTKDAVFFSAPDVRRILLNATVKLPLLEEIKISWRLPTFKNHVYTATSGHHWEIGKLGYSVNRLAREMKKTGFAIEKHYVNNDTPKNHYFLLRKRS